MKITACIGLIAMSLMPFNVMANVTNPVSVTFNQFPPWQVMENGQFGGINHLIIKRLAHALGFHYKYVECPWPRCLHMLKQGQLDLVISLLKNRERQVYLHFIEPAFTITAGPQFYVMNKSIRDYQDLPGSSIAILRDALLFEPFASDLRIKKVIVTNEMQMLGLLVKGRVDAILGENSNLKYTIIKARMNHKIRRASYDVAKPSRVYMAVSKRTSHSQLFHRLSLEVNSMREKGEFKALAEAFYRHLKVSQQPKNLSIQNQKSKVENAKQ